ncbi:hypothetical protein HA402_014653 [Bradysia odoriphaga]|nr:hypothetical protein HA402_014653 [Bradysia odoriphaga]
MASSRLVFTTLDDLECSSYPTLRLRLTDDARVLGSQRPQQPTFIDDLRRKYSNLMQQAKGSVHFEENSSESARKINEAKLDAIFNDMVKDIEKTRSDAKKSLQNLSATQQEDVLTFWSLAQTFFADVMKWMQTMFQTVLEKIRQGFRLAKKIVKELFDTIGRWLDVIF